MGLGERIKEFRLRKGMTQQQLADLIGVQRAAISKYEKNIVDIPLKQLKRIANALNANIYDLVDDNTEIGTIGNYYFKRNSDNSYEFESTKIMSEIPDKLISDYNKLNTLGKGEAIKRVEELTEIPKYTKPDNED